VTVGDIPPEGTGSSTLHEMAKVRLFAAARDAAGTGRDELPGDTVGDVLDAATARYGADFAVVLSSCRIWVNGNSADLSDPVCSTDELAVLPPVSGG
jgi:molybdopterin synthase sulfur carrier subunit